MRPLGLLLLSLLASFLIAVPANANYGYSAGISINPTKVVVGGTETITYRVVPHPSCPTGPVSFMVDATTIAKVPGLTPSTCSATAHYTIPKSIQCGQHTFMGTMESTSVPAIAYLFSVPCPNTPGGILWGTAHGTAIVHDTLTINAPRVPTTAWVRYAWRVGNTYTTIRTRQFTLPWSAVGKTVYGVVRVTENGVTNYWRSYRFGPVKG